MADEPVAHILVVDDEVALLGLVQMYLGRLGYSVEKAENAAAALAVVNGDAGRFKVAVVDLTLPDRPGKDLAIELARMNEELKVLVCSGYPFETEALPADVKSRFGFLQKPFLPKMLAAAVEELLKR